MTINWDKVQGLIPVVVQDSKTYEVLMLAYMNEEAYKKTISTKIAHYFSRSRQKLWKKGESSGHFQRIKDILIDCDGDTLLLKVEQKGVACHTGRKSCFYTSILSHKEVSKVEIDTTKIYNVIDTLYHTIAQKRDDDPTKSYTAKLLKGKQNSLLKKIVEESSELCFAIKDNNEKEIIYESADLIYHYLVALASKNISPSLVEDELQKRFGLSGIDEKNSRVEE